MLVMGLCCDGIHGRKKLIVLRKQEEKRIFMHSCLTSAVTKHLGNSPKQMGQKLCPLNSVIKNFHYSKRARTCHPATSCVRNQDATTVPA